MNAFPNVDMQEVTRLTRKGKLKEAMRLLGGGLMGSGMAGGSESASSDAKAQAAATDAATPARHKTTLLDLAKPGSKAGGTWTLGAEPGEARDDATAPAEARPANARHAGPVPGAASAPNPWTRFVDGSILPDLAGLSGLGGTARAVTVPDGARFDTHEHAGPSGSRRYKLYVPARHDGRPAPLVVMLHGCTQSPDDFAAGTRMNALAEEFGFLVAYPEQSKRANAQKCWNWFEAGDQRRDSGEPALIAGITREIVAAHGADPARVFVAGLSAGGAAATIMGQRYPELYAAVGVHSGLACGAARDMGSAFAAMRGGAPVTAGERVVPTIVFHGDRDTTVAPVNGDHVLEQARAGASARAVTEQGVSTGGVGYTRTVHREADGRERLESWRIHGAGHAWSGGSADGSYTLPGGPDASREMLRFFLDRDL
ncbi:PHB depolymerase family esterase [Aurantimonas sp. 22II-16-19i]|uniref:extracellular catalytic domain type 1 short-chain-length polyhydroxyalkanoate depolymerase n=1 Tax=Aurantimonas sp. 22II-16-19i TaxID=1317114 RepID=UPI0009F7D2DD|nr:PHB depolymerase family esterase [Aurantimonas sp. 22II-16-19i]ORE94777.1 PHB depolymerase family esterase [Aurantimonas sp. 22II-16-19i]